MQVPLNSGHLLLGDTYRIDRHIGKGGFGIAYRAIQVRLNKRVVIKELFPGDCDRIAGNANVIVDGEIWTPELLLKSRRQMIEEGRILAFLNHPCIVKALDVFEENDTAYLVMEFVEGENLRQYTVTHRLEVVEAVEFSRDAARLGRIVFQQ